MLKKLVVGFCFVSFKKDDDTTNYPRKSDLFQYNVVTNMFKLKVGEERVMVGNHRNTLESMCKEKLNDIPDELRSTLYDTGNP